VLLMFGRPPDGLWLSWIAVPLAAACAAIATAIGQGRSQSACFICSTRESEHGMFRCPRCRQQICAQPGCWVARHFRCRLCREREVVLFPIAEQWWASRLGRRATRGECASCFKDAREADLRECGQCHCAMCKRCWDFHNGQCSHCDWVIPDMPSQLYAFITPRPVSANQAKRNLRR